MRFLNMFGGETMKYLVSIIFSVAFPAFAIAQTYIPMAKPAMPALIMKSNNAAYASDEGYSGPAIPNASDPFTCTTVPSLTSLKVQQNNSVMSSAQAIKLGLPMAGVGLSTNNLVLVQDWTRSKPCLSTDGKTQLLYGQAIRIVATISDMSAGTDLTLATIAAHATLNKKASSIQAELVGVSDPKIIADAATLLGPLDVANFASKSSLTAELVKAVANLPVANIDFLGVVRTPTDYSANVGSAFAIQQIANQKSCAAAKLTMGTSSTSVSAAIEATYVELVGLCDNSMPTGPARAAAQAFLNGVSVKK